MNRKRRLLDLREQALAALEAGKSLSEVSEVFGIHCTTLYRWRVRQQQGALATKPCPGGPRKIDTTQEEKLLAQVQAHADATLDEHCRLWHQQQGQQVSPSTMCRALQRLNWTRKKRQ